jgi:CxxC-x17-CxxC domain-containing protein
MSYIAPEREKVETEVICSKCGIKTTVPFVPDGRRPVYCKDCYRIVKPYRSMVRK